MIQFVCLVSCISLTNSTKQGKHGILHDYSSGICITNCTGLIISFLVLLWDVINHNKADRNYGKESLKDLVKNIIKQKLLEYPNYDAKMLNQEPTTKNNVHDFMLQPSNRRLLRY